MKDLKDQKNVKNCFEYSKIVSNTINDLFDLIYDENGNSKD